MSCDVVVVIIIMIIRFCHTVVEKCLKAMALLTTVHRSCSHKVSGNGTFSSIDVVQMCTKHEIRCRKFAFAALYTVGRSIDVEHDTQTIVHFLSFVSNLAYRNKFGDNSICWPGQGKRNKFVAPLDGRDEREK